MTNFSHSITAALGAILISTMFIGAAVGPAAVTPRPRLRLRPPPEPPAAGRTASPPPWLAVRPPPKHRNSEHPSMSIFSRTRDIIAANVIDLVNRSDDPAKTIRVIIMEMEETLVEVRASAARCIADQKEKRRQVAQLAELQDSWAERAGLRSVQGPRGSRPAGAGREGEADRPRRGARRGDRRHRPFAARARSRHLQAAGEAARGARSGRTRSPPASRPPHNQVRMREMYAGEPHRGGLLQFRPARARGRSMRKARPRR